MRGVRAGSVDRPDVVRSLMHMDAAMRDRAREHAEMWPPHSAAWMAINGRREHIEVDGRIQPMSVVLKHARAMRAHP